MKLLLYHPGNNKMVNYLKLSQYYTNTTYFPIKWCKTCKLPISYM